QRSSGDDAVMATVPRPPMQISPSWRPASSDPGTLAPRSMHRSPAAPVVTERRSAAALRARSSTSLPASALTLGAKPRLLLMDELLLLRLNGHTAKFRGPPSAE